MERFFTTKIYLTSAGVDDSCTAECVSVQLTPYSEELTVDEVAIYWKNCVLRRPFYPAGTYMIVVSLTRYPVKSFVEVHKSLKK